ncbi:MAG TPA: entericidin [Candidatus Omnitrophica bacterium]|nr:entericidin [Candidatus Omnitrophota bacterium]
MKTNFLLLLAALFLLTSVLGCNMLRGAGQDIENAGGSIQRTVDHND